MGNKWGGRMKLTSIIGIVVAVMLVYFCLNYLSLYKPPSLELRADGNHFSAVQGSSCWKKLLSDVCSDTTSPPEIFEFAGFTPPVVARGTEIQLTFGRKPDKGSIQVHLLTEAMLPVEMLSNDSFHLPEDPGEYTYSAHASWGQGRSSEYYFAVIVE